jgi:bifunctional DNA-binding transcriptional regulator/antitoxin component of YhaV-PrlF toxin-antitoxin module
MPHTETVFIRSITDQWLPLSDSVLQAVGWKEGDYLQIEVVGDCLVLTKLDPQPKKESNADRKTTGKS